MVDPAKPSKAKSMGEYSTIMARDGHEFQAWLAAAPGRPRGALVVIQEIFGVNSHIRKVTDGFAADGYTAENTLRDLAAAIAVVKHSGRAATVGYCWGGTQSYLAACQLPLACAVVYYGRVASHLEQKPKCPVMYHFGKEDRSIPHADVARTKAANPHAPLFVYEGAGHGFNCEQRDAYNPQVAALARARTLDFLGRYVAGGEPVKG
jgi:carboxymethylenebutenolidase